MRDGTILQTFGDLESKVGHDIAVVLEAMNIIETRQRALESVLLGSRFGLVRLAFLQLLSPKAVMGAVFARQQNLLSQYRRDMAEAIKKKATGLLKPGVATVSALLALFCFTGCVSSSRYWKVYAENVKLQNERDVAARLANFCQEQQAKLVDIWKASAPAPKAAPTPTPKKAKK